MGKIKTWYRSIPLWLAIFLFVAAASILASFVSNKVTKTVNNASLQLCIKYPYTGRIGSDFEITDVGNIQNDSNQADLIYVTITDNLNISELIGPASFSDDDRRLYNAYQFILQYAPLFIYSFSLLMAVLLLYFTKLKKPFALLLSASAKIAENQFDFSLDYSGHDEMARLCGAFEKMRSAVDENNMRMRQIIEERKQLNDAYTHDLRTPIAVLKGYTDTLCEYLPTGQLPQEKVLETVHTMSTHVERLDQFVILKFN